MADDNHTGEWRRMRFKRNKVWMALDDKQRPLVEKGKVLIKYQLDQSHQYWVHQSKVQPLDDAADDQQTSSPPKPDQADHEPPPHPGIHDHQDRAIRIYTDGASSGNPGPAGIGVVMLYRDKRKEISAFIGKASNNVAELEAIRQGLTAVKNRDLPVLVFTDSRYALGVLTLGWKARQNQDLVADIRELIKKFRQIQFIKVKGHAGDPENERADRLAVEAIR